MPSPSRARAGDVIAGDFVGTDPTGKIAEGNAINGFESILVDASNATIGGGAAADRNIVSASGLYGIRLTGGTGDQILNSYIGTDQSGTIALQNKNLAIFIDGASNVTIGGTTAAVRNVISGNRLDGISIADTAGNVIQGNYIGTDATGTVALANGGSGISTSASGNLVGGTTAGAGNLISGNGGAGLLINFAGPNAPGNIVQGNLIGTDKTGLLPIPNGDAGINIGNAGGGGYDNVIGGTTAAARNVISGNHVNGISVGGGGSGNVIEGNYIGVDVTGLVALPNQGEGVDSDGSSNMTVGGTAAGAGNVIAANTLDGILVFSPGAVIQGNLIGLGADGFTPPG